MARVTKKIPIEVTSNQTVTVPADADALGIFFIKDKCCLYVVGNPDSGEQELKLNMVSENDGSVKDGSTHIGTFQHGGGVIHVFVVQ